MFYDIQSIQKITPDPCARNRISSPVSSYIFCIQQSLLLCDSERCQNVTKNEKRQYYSFTLKCKNIWETYKDSQFCFDLCTCLLIHREKIKLAKCYEIIRYLTPAWLSQYTVSHIAQYISACFLSFSFFSTQTLHRIVSSFLSSTGFLTGGDGKLSIVSWAEIVLWNMTLDHHCYHGWLEVSLINGSRWDFSNLLI